MIDVMMEEALSRSSHGHQQYLRSLLHSTPVHGAIKEFSGFANVCTTSNLLSFLCLRHTSCSARPPEISLGYVITGGTSLMGYGKDG
jgi:hypothetical protein